MRLGFWRRDCQQAHSLGFRLWTASSIALVQRWIICNVSEGIVVRCWRRIEGWCGVRHGDGSATAKLQIRGEVCAPRSVKSCAQFGDGRRCCCGRCLHGSSNAVVDFRLLSCCW
jgi:hypothetical protein